MASGEELRKEWRELFVYTEYSWELVLVHDRDYL